MLLNKTDNTNKGRLYNTKFGHFPSVTTILSKTKDPISKAILANWRRDKTQEELQLPLIRGNYTHKRIECQLLGEAFNDPINQDFEPYYQSFSEFLTEIDEVLLIEQSIYHPKFKYAGTVDCVAVVDKIPVLIDWKTADKPKPDKYLLDYRLQAGAYSLAIPIVYDIEITKAYVVIGIPGQSAQVDLIEQDELELYQSLFLQRLKIFNS